MIQKACFIPKCFKKHLKDDNNAAYNDKHQVQTTVHFINWTSQ